ncbi:hypothetical protein Nepgr_025155 [Nepenthes gracilis]|uniref:Uncharacterized protein n=1 Tax=Nepenthes gracilis TaxID=150966 RepID=A0AAD3T790_NEPGR|nr:hypothetical protein Nepgr_025155 [Nepenthes gracilis]
MFVTFSKRYPMSKEGVIEIFTTVYGECIKLVHMQDVEADEHPSFANIVVSSSSKVEVTLHGAEKVKLTIDGKYVWQEILCPSTQDYHHLWENY